MSLHRTAILDPGPAALAEVVRFHRRWAPWVQRGLRPWVRLRAEGAEHLPAQGPALVLANHVSFLDPILLNCASPRPIQFMATQALLQEGWMGRVVANMGGVPKRKFSSDLKAVKLLRAWAEEGAIVGLFPEGQRSWDGRPLPLLDGIEKLIRLLGLPVITARIHNADHVWPRWARRPRHGTVTVELDPPERFGRDQDPAALRAWVEDRLRVDPARARRTRVLGVGLARGITNPLFACPCCAAVDTLVERWSTLACPRCGAAWRVQADLTLQGQGASPSLSLAQAIDRAHEALALEGTPDPARLDREGVALESGPCTLFDVSGDTPVLVGQGRLRLTREGLELHGTPWRLGFTELRATSVELRRRLQLQTRDVIYEVVLPQESVVKWEWLVPLWQARARG